MTHGIDQLNLNAAKAAPHFDQWLGVWAMEPDAASGLVRLVANTDMFEHLQQRQPIPVNAGGFYYREDRDGVAVLKLMGTLQKQQASMTRATSTVLARRELRAAAADDSIGAVLLHIESPGGTAIGTMELAEEIARVNQTKPVFAYIEDLGASAAYWLASQARRITANPMARVGSIGTYNVVVDYSGQAEKDGIRVHVVSSGGVKGMGVPGTEITQEVLDEVQRGVDAVNEFFLLGVAAGRGMKYDEVRLLADGRVHFADAAQRLRLIDAVQSYDAAFDEARAAAAQTLNSGDSDSMSAKETIEAIKAACQGCEAEFINECVERELSIEDCKSAYIEHLLLTNMALSEQNEKLEAVNAGLSVDIERMKQPVVAGVDPLEEEGGESEAVDYFGRVREVMAEKKIDRAAAMAMVNKEYPELRAEMLAAVNQ